jgi:Transposase DNA-binding
VTGKRKGGGDTSWVDGEIAACEFADVRLGRRFRTLLEQIGDAVGESVPTTCQDWANTKAAYRFFSNERVDEGDILAGHFQATRDRFAASNGTVLVLHDTTEFSFQRADAIRLVAFALAPSAASCYIQASQ